MLCNRERNKLHHYLKNSNYFLKRIAYKAPMKNMVPAMLNNNSIHIMNTKSYYSTGYKPILTSVLRHCPYSMMFNPVESCFSIHQFLAHSPILINIFSHKEKFLTGIYSLLLTIVFLTPTVFIKFSLCSGVKPGDFLQSVQRACLI